METMDHKRNHITEAVEDTKPAQQPVAQYFRSSVISIPYAAGQILETQGGSGCRLYIERG
jgi:hypothetical protein